VQLYIGLHHLIASYAVSPTKPFEGLLQSRDLGYEKSTLLQVAQFLDIAFAVEPCFAQQPGYSAIKVVIVLRFAGCSDLFQKF
jgi:hypothetical protein